MPTKTEIQDVLCLYKASKNTDKIPTDTQTLSSPLCSTPFLLPNCGFLAVVIISDIRDQPEACAVSHPHRSAEFNLTGRGCLWERADQSRNQIIAQLCFTHT